MKKILPIILSLIISLVFLPTGVTKAYEGGLLQDHELIIGGESGPNGTTTTLITDNDISTSYAFGAYRSTNDRATFTFQNPVNIDQFMIKVTGFFSVYYYDANGTVLRNMTLINQSGEARSDSPNEGVKSITILNYGNYQGTLFEFDVYGTVQAPHTNTLVLEGELVSGNVQLDWTGGNSNITYNLKKSSSPGGPYVTIGENLTDTSFTDSEVVKGSTYYYIVVPVNTFGEGTPSNEVPVTIKDNSTEEPTGDRAILTITLINGLEKEFDLSMAEVNSFINWYDDKEEGTGLAKFAIDKHNNNKGPFSKRTDYVIFKNILSFEVSEYNTVTSQ